MKPRRHNLTGKKFGAWSVLGLGERGNDGKPRWRCECICGCIRDIYATFLVHGKTRSCGCVWAIVAHDQYKTHGMSRTPEYKAWRSMKIRCTLPSCKSFRLYGARGISVCERWSIFENFFADMGKRPSPKHSIERVDNNKGYSPDNCRWATINEQAHNRRTNKKLTSFGVTMLQVDWAKKLGYANSSCLNNALKRKTLEQIIQRRGAA